MNHPMTSTSARLACITLILMGMAAAAIGAKATSTGDTSVEVDALSNVTVVVKNREFPLKMRMTVQPCAISACIDV
jgi:hypothetical protein